MDELKTCPRCSTRPEGWKKLIWDVHCVREVCWFVCPMCGMKTDTHYTTKGARAEWNKIDVLEEENNDYCSQALSLLRRKGKRRPRRDGQQEALDLVGTMQTVRSYYGVAQL